jgi:hypothetical protein
LTDQLLLRDYAERRSEAAFAELVRRHVDLIYSAACRWVGKEAVRELASPKVRAQLDRTNLALSKRHNCRIL